MRVLQRLPLSRKILLGILPLFLLFISVSVLLQNRFQEREMVEQAQVSAHTHADILRESLVSMMVTNLEVDTAFIERINTIVQLDTVYLLVNELRLRKEAQPALPKAATSRRFVHIGPRDAMAQRVLESGTPEFVRTGEKFRGVIPFTASKTCQECHAVPIGYALGAADLSVSFAGMTVATRANWTRSLLIFLGFTGIVIFVSSFMFTRFVARPVDRLVAATRAISTGDLETTIPGAAAGSGADDELAILAARFDEMRISLKQKIGELDMANRELLQKNRDIEEALDRLHRTQEDLVRSERIALTGTLTAQLSHEINNPVHNIQSLLSSSLRRMGSGEPATELVSVALEEVTRLAGLTRQMLDMYRGAPAAFEQAPFNVMDIVGELARLYGEPFAAQGITFRVDPPGDLPPVSGSRDKLKQVFLNLLLNARDAMPHGGTIAVTARAGNGTVTVDVEDTGTGIPPENIDRIFDAFFTTKKEVSGVGLGLSVSHGIVHQHGGTIAVDSAIGRGTRFTITLPMREERDARP
jgi:signal transduction histidine kinase